MLRSVPGVGEQLSLTLLAYLPELGTLNRKQVAALVGWLPSTGTAELHENAAPSGVAGRESEASPTLGRRSPAGVT